MCLPFSCFLRGTPGNPGLFRKISRVFRDFLIKKETALTDSLSLLFPGFTSAAQCQIPMRLLFETDSRNCSPGEEPISVPSVRAIIVSYGRVAMVRNAKDDYYRFPGGEIRSGETNISALAGRLREETGLIVSPGTETEYGCVVCRSRSETGGILLREVFYYICRTEPYRVPVRVNSAPSRESLSLCFVSPVTAAEVNRLCFSSAETRMMLGVENRVLELLVRDGYL